MATINLEKLICSFIERTQYRHLIAEIQETLKDQGLEYKDGQIVEIVKPFEIKAGQWYMCIKNFEMEDGSCAYIQGRLYQGDGKGRIQNEKGGWVGYWEYSGDKYFRPATKDDIPHEPEKELTEFERQFEAYMFHPSTDPETISACCKKLLSLARKQIAEEINIEGMVDTYITTPEEGTEFGLPVACMVRAYRKGITDTLEKIKGK